MGSGFRIEKLQGVDYTKSCENEKVRRLAGEKSEMEREWARGYRGGDTGTVKREKR